MTTKRIDLMQHCMTEGNTITFGNARAGKTKMLFIWYWYVKYYRGDSTDVVLFSNPHDWLAHLERLAPNNQWLLSEAQYRYEGNNPTFMRMQGIARGVEQGKRYVCGVSEIWAEKDSSTGRYRYFFSTGESGQAYESLIKWKTAIKPCLWDWTEKEAVSDEQSA